MFSSRAFTYFKLCIFVFFAGKRSLQPAALPRRVLDSGVFRAHPAEELIVARRDSDERARPQQPHVQDDRPRTRRPRRA